MISPCCIGKVVPQPSVAPHMRAKPKLRQRSRRLQAADVDEPTFELLAQLADKSEGVPPKSLSQHALKSPTYLPSQVQDETEAHFLRGKLCKTAVEMDRIEWVREQDSSYHAHLLRMWGMEGYSKTDMLIGWPNDTNQTQHKGHERERMCGGDSMGMLEDESVTDGGRGGEMEGGGVRMRESEREREREHESRIDHVSLLRCLWRVR